MKKIYLFTILFALLGMNQVCAETCYLYEHLQEASVSTKSKNTAIFTTDDLGNIDGIDTIRFEYKMSSTLAKKIKVRYSTDGTNFEDIDGSDKSSTDKWRGLTGNGDDIYVLVPETLRTSIKKIQFAVYDNSTFSYTYSVRRVQISRCPTIKVDDLNTTSYAFHKTAVGTQLSQEFTLSTFNVSEELSIVKSGANADYFSYELSAASGSCPTTYTLTVTYAPLTETTGEETHVAAFEVSANGSTATLNVSGTASALVTPTYTWNGQETYLVGDDALNLSTLWTSTSTAEKVYSIKSWTAEEGAPTEGATAPAINAGMLSLGQAGTLVIKVSQEATTGYTEGTKEQTIVINRYTPEFAWYSKPVYRNEVINNFWTSTNKDTKVVESTSAPTVATIANATLTTYYEEGSVRISIEQAENYKWKGKSDYKEFTVETKANHVPFAMNNASIRDELYVSNSSDGTISCDDDGCIVLTQGGAAWTSNELYYIIRFEGIPGDLSFTYRSTNSLATSYGRGDAFVVYESATGEDDTWEELWRAEVPGNTDDHNVDPQPLQLTTRYLKFYFHATYTGNFKNIQVTERKQFDAEDVAFGDVEINSDAKESSLVFKHANAGYNVSVVLNEESETKHFSIDHTTVANTGGDRYGDEPFVITYTPSELGEHTATVTFSDERGNEKVVTLTGKTIKITPTIETEPTASEITYGQKLSASLLTDGVAKHGETTLEGEFAWVDGEEELSAGKYSKEVIFTPSNTAIYETVIFEVDVTVEKATPVINAVPQATDIKIGQKLSESELYNGDASVEGTFAWEDDAIVPESTGTYKYSVVFTPNDATNYKEVVVEVEVQVTDTTTAVDETEAEVKAIKLMRNGQVFILCDGKVYNLHGLRVE